MSASLSPANAAEAVERVYGYYGSSLHCVPGGSGEVLYPCGSGICSVPAAGHSGASRYWPIGSGSYQVSAMAVHPTGRLVVVAERRLKVSLQVFSYPNRKKVQERVDVAKVEIVSMAFSRCGGFLAVLSGAPAYALSLYTVDVENAQVQPYVESTMQFGYPLTDVTFNPLNPEELCTSGGGHVVFWHTDNMAGSTLVPTEGKVSNLPNARIQTHVYLPTQDVVCGTDGGLLLLFPHSSTNAAPSVISPKTNDDNSHLKLPNDTIAALCLTRQHLIVCFSSGVVGFLASKDLGVVVKVVRTHCARSTTMTLTPRCDSLIIGDRGGSMHQVILPDYADCTDDGEFVLSVPKVIAIQKGFGGRVVGVAHLQGTAIAVINKEGILSVVDYGLNAILCQTHIGPSPAFIVSVTGAPNMVAIASHTGSVRFYHISDTSNNTANPGATTVTVTPLLKGSFSDAPASFIESTPCGTYVCMGDGQALYYFQINNHGETAITASNAEDAVEFLGSVRLAASTSAVAICFFRDSVPAPATNNGSNDAPTTTNPIMALVSHTSGDTVLMRLPTKATFVDLADPDTLVIDAAPAQLLVNSWRLDMPLYQFTVAGVFNDYITIICQSLDKEGRLCLLDRNLNPERKDRESRVVKPQVLFRDFDKKGSFIGFIRGGKYLLASACDGKLILRDAAAYRAHLSPQPVTKERKDPVVALQRHVSITGGIGCLCVSDATQRIVTAGTGGVVIVWGINLPSNLAGLVHPSGSLQIRIAPDSFSTQTPILDDTVFFTDKKKQQRQELDLMRFETFRNAIKERLSNLRKQLQAIRAENDTADESERVDLPQFLVDSQKEVFEDAVDGAIMEMRSEMDRANLHRDYVVELIKKEVWDVMDTPLHILRPLDTTANHNIVHSFHRRKESPTQSVIIKKLKFLRLVEMADRKRRDVHELEDVYEDPADALDDGGDFDSRGTMGTAAASPTNPPAGGGTAAASPLSRPTRLEVGADGEEFTVEIDPVEELLSKDVSEQARDDPVPFLYDNLMTFTRSRAVIQQHLLSCRVRHIKNEFNKTFMELVERRKAEIHKIEERNVRCRHILKELGEEGMHHIFAPFINPKDDPAHVFGVKDEDVQASKSKDPAERARQAQAEIDRQRWIARHGSDDSSEKALKVWMDGRLDKDIKTLEVSVAKPDFADEASDKFVIPEERTDEQNNVYKEYEQRLEKRTQEVNESREALRHEFEGLQTQNRAAAKKFDEEVMKLFAARVVASQGGCRVELQQIKLAQSIVMHSERVRIARTLEARRQTLSDALQRATRVSQKAALTLDTLTASVDSLREIERQRDRTIRQVHPFNHPEFGDILMRFNIKKVKAGKRKKDEQQAMLNAQLAELEQTGSKGKFSSTLNPTQDPYAFVELHEGGRLRMIDEELAAAMKPLEKPSDLLNVPGPLWDAYNQYRQDRLVAERDLTRLLEEQAEAHGNLAIAEAERSQAAEAVSEALKISDAFITDSVDGVYDVDGIYVLRQGQVEVDSAPVVTDFSDAILIKVEHIERLNKLIRESSKEKEACIGDIMEKRKEIALGEWEIEHLAFSIATLEMQLKHLHTLRVTKHMQEFIAGGGEDHNAQQRQKIQAKIQHVRSTMAKKIEERGSQMQKLRRTIKDKEVENYILLDQVDDAKALVDDRRTIKELQSTDAGTARNDKLMRDMRVTRKLEDVAKAQQSEMGTLRQEIDRLRERTFPSFAVVSKRVVGNPDQI